MPRTVLAGLAPASGWRGARRTVAAKLANLAATFRLAFGSLAAARDSSLASLLCMTLPRLIGRTLGALGPELKLGALLTLANLLLACAQFAEPVLYGRIVDTLIGAQGAGRAPTFADLLPWLLAWAGFALFTIFAGVLVSLHADRMAHRRRLGVMTLYFEHVAQLPLAYHGGTHSGRQMKVMLEGADTLWGIWLAFFRDVFASMAALVVMMPVALWMNWRLGAAAGRPCGDVHAAGDVRDPQDPWHAGGGRGISVRPRRARLRHPGQHRAGAVVRAGRGGGARPQGCRLRCAAGADAGAVVVGGGVGGDPRLDHADGARHLRAGRGAARQWTRPRSARSSPS